MLPRVEVFPCPEPEPLPKSFLRLWAPKGIARLCNPTLGAGAGFFTAGFFGRETFFTAAAEGLGCAGVLVLAFPIVVIFFIF